MNRGTVVVNFTIGFGNNLFQYCYARILAETHGLDLSHDAIPELGIEAKNVKNVSFLPTIVANDSNYKKLLFTQIPKCNIVVSGYFEDYKIFKPHLYKIRNWFTKHEITNTEDVILHLRLQNRLIHESHHKNHLKASAIKELLNKFDYKRLHIVTDAAKWAHHDTFDIESIQEQVRVGPNPTAKWVSTQQSVEYINHLVDELAVLDPIVHCNGEEMMEGSGGLRGGFINDFNLLRSFNQVIIHNSTFSWWAATLSGANKVAIHNPWKIAKPPQLRRNLGETNYEGWFPWGGKEALYFTHYRLGV